MEWFRKNAKAVATFVVGVLIQAVTDIINGTAQVDLLDWQGWLRYVGLSLVAAITVWVTGNKRDAEQVKADTEKLSVPEQAEVAQDVLTKLPDPISDSVVSGYPDWVSG